MFSESTDGRSFMGAGTQCSLLSRFFKKFTFASLRDAKFSVQFTVPSDLLWSPFLQNF